MSLLLQLSRMCIFSLLSMGFLLALTAVRLFPAGLFPLLLFMCGFGRKTPVWSGGAAVRGRGRTLHLSCASRIVSSSLPLLSDKPFTTAGPRASSSSPCIQKLPRPTAGLMFDLLLLPQQVTICVLPKGSWKQDSKQFWVVPGCQVISSFSFWWWTAHKSLCPSLFQQRCEGIHTLYKDGLHYLMPSAVPASMLCMQEALVWCLHALGLNLTHYLINI